MKYYDGTVFTWEQGRRLSSATQGNITYTYTYNDEGVRISKDEYGIMHRYIVNGTQIVAETWGDIIVVYLYDEYGSPIGMQVRYEDMANKAGKGDRGRFCVSTDFWGIKPQHL